MTDDCPFLPIEPISVALGDDATHDTTPLLNADGSFYDAAGHTCEMLIKADRYADDDDATPYAGALAGNATTLGWTMRFEVPRTEHAAVASKWFKIRITTPVLTGSKLHTVAASPYYVVPV